ncbi:GlcG/HbpS family heme-binding protein [Falsiroseomonas selenitidurans]|uniref:Heme-binding protein n=1 Tax=Falsiroseomonas selenitidurans TaxID=2716335 RepID=A0ABX1EB69_9PROT|nr:heme-binding protein [Falsiroseomonas selenitidurans]NKC34241.1 heme-binding protein [Falsiroseomonas selenitidurans]
MTETRHAAPAGFQHGITAAQARIVVDETLAKGRALGLAPLTVVVLDAGGQLKAALREDGASLLRTDIAWGKAFGAMALGFGSRELARRSQSMTGFMNALSDLAGGRAVPVPGGVLVRAADGAVLGAVGVSGDASDKDEVCAVAGVHAAGLTPDTGDAA